MICDSNCTKTESFCTKFHLQNPHLHRSSTSNLQHHPPIPLNHHRHSKSPFNHTSKKHLSLLLPFQLPSISHYSPSPAIFPCQFSLRFIAPKIHKTSSNSLISAHYHCSIVGTRAINWIVACQSLVSSIKNQPPQPPQSFSSLRHV
jgi:hypothetical protein